MPCLKSSGEKINRFRQKLVEAIKTHAALHVNEDINPASGDHSSNQLDYDREVMYKSKQYLLDHIRQDPEKRRPFCLTVRIARRNKGDNQGQPDPCLVLPLVDM